MEREGRREGRSGGEERGLPLHPQPVFLRDQIGVCGGDGKGRGREGMGGREGGRYVHVHRYGGGKKGYIYVYIRR